jgi:hypothetical protein
MPSQSARRASAAPSQSSAPSTHADVDFGSNQARAAALGYQRSPVPGYTKSPSHLGYDTVADLSGYEKSPSTLGYELNGIADDEVVDVGYQNDVDIGYQNTDMGYQNAILEPEGELTLARADGYQNDPAQLAIADGYQNAPEFLGDHKVGYDRSPDPDAALVTEARRRGYGTPKIMASPAVSEAFPPGRQPKRA